MTQPNHLEKPTAHWPGEKLWNVSLLPVSPGPRAHAEAQPLALLVELPRPQASLQGRRRQAA